MATTISSELNQGYRNALLSYYLGQYVPNSGNDNLTSLVQTPEDVYEYLLIDPLVNNDVQTSRVAQAMSSIQQYINGIVLNMEPGYSTQMLDADKITQWNNGGNQYAIWGGYVELDTYIDPTLRKNKTEYFSDLQNALGQNSLNEDNIEQAVQVYLNDFETVANLDMVSGFIDGNVVDKDKYYLIGRTKNSPADYYWRTLDMSQNAHNAVTLGAWSEWKKIDVNINTDVMVGTLRPMVFNNRLYIVWYEKTTSSTSDGSSNIVNIKMYSANIQFDGSWSAPQIIYNISSDVDPMYEELFQATDYMTVALANGSINYETFNAIFALYAETSEDQDSMYTSLSAVMDPWGNIEQENYVNSDDIFSFFAGDENQKYIQFNISGDGISVTTLISSDLVNDDFKGEMQGFMPSGGDVSASVDNENGTLTLRINNAINIFQFQTIQSDYNKKYNDNNQFGFTIEMDPVVENIFGYGSINLEGKTNQAPFTELRLVADNYETSHIYASDDTIYYEDDHKMYYTNGIYFNKDVSMYLNSESDYYLWVRTGTSSSGWRSYSFKLPAVTIYSPQWSLGYSDGDSALIYSPVDYNTINNINKISCNYKDSGSYVFNWSVEVSETLSSEETRVRNCTMQYTVEVINLVNIAPPKLAQQDSGNGVVQYLDFNGGTFSDGSDLAISPLRLNTLFAMTLINKANIGIDELLTWDTQLTEEPALDGGDPVVMDFNGANGLYFWELFFHMPYLVAYRLYQEAQYDDAQQWLNYIFAPSARGRTSSNPNYPEPDYWNVRPLVENGSAQAVGSMVQDPTDPDAIATADPVHYQKAITMAYISNLIAAADADYRLLTNDGLSLAKLRYCQVRDLLGPRPDINLLNQWQPDTLADVAAKENTALTAFENIVGHTLVAFSGENYTVQDVVDNPEFLAPLNTQLLQYWNTVDYRLYNLRHNLTIDGQPMVVPLYAPLVNPTLLLQQSASAGSLANSVAALSAILPPYRFSVMLQSARAAVATLSQFGQTLLGYYERGESAGLQELQQQQALNISSFTISLQQQAISALNADQQALEASRAVAQQRYDHYYMLYSNGLSAGETSAMALRDESSASMAAASPFLTAGMALKTIPNIFGLADGGAEPGAPTLATGMVLQLTGEIQGLTAQQTEMSENYRRRSEDWQIQYQQAQSEVDAIDKQLDALAIRQQAAQTSLQLSQAEQANLQDTLTFMTTRFTQSSLYTWLTGQLSSLYYQAYDAVLSLCLSTQACWQYEMGDVTSTFIQTNAWNDSYHGLLVGETLTLNLLQMESAWLSRNQRRLELTKTISLKQLDSEALSKLISFGTAQFALSESLFDNDYPGHYLRQIKFVTVSLPTLVGPYQDVRMTLTQSGSSTLLKADINGVNYLNDNTKGNANNIVTNLRASQQIAVSTGLNDSGLFMLNFGDERYLPFEGTGTVSSWQLSFPRYQSDEQQAILNNLNDVIIQVHYTALYGGSSFENAVVNTL